MGEFCGTQRPTDLDISGNAVDLLFFTDESGESRGWKLHYTTEGKVAWGPPSLTSNGADQVDGKKNKWL